VIKLLSKAILIVSVFILSMVIILSGCMPKISSVEKDIDDSMAEEPKKLTIYSGRQEKFIIPMVERFEQQTGIKVNLISGKATEYAHRIVEEGRNTQADVFLSNDAGVLEYLRRENMLAPIDENVLKVVPVNYRAVDNTWVGVTVRCRVFIYNKDLIKPEDMPKSLFDVVDPKYKGQFTINRAGNESMVTYFASVNSLVGPKETLELLKGIMANEPLILQSHTDVRRAVGSGEVKFGFVNNYHYKMQLLEEGMNNVGVIFPDQGEGEMGTFANVSGAAITKHAKHPKNALAFIQFLLEPEQQKLNDETPIIPGIEGVEYDEYKTANTSLSDVGPLWEETIKLMEEAGYSD